MNILIVTGGTEPSKEVLFEYKNKASFVIGADKGCNVLYKYGINPDLILGDFDSGDLSAIEYFENLGIKVERFSTAKDYTDTHLAYNRAKDIEGVEKIYLLGGTGTRLDHMLGNIGLFLNSLEDGVHLEIVDDNNIVYVTDRRTIIEPVQGRNLSFHALSERVTNFSIRGARYELEGYEMKLLEPRAVCNEFIDKKVEITFDSGRVLIMLTKD